ncbi:WD repeat-containing protein 97 [Plecturocebus cupreus]
MPGPVCLRGPWGVPSCWPDPGTAQGHTCLALWLQPVDARSPPGLLLPVLWPDSAAGDLQRPPRAVTGKSCELLGSGTAVAEMEAEVWEASSFSEGYSLVLDSDLYDADGYDVPDPGLLTENNELTFTESPQVLPFLTSSRRWPSLTPRPHARRLWLLLRSSLHEVVEKARAVPTFDCGSAHPGPQEKRAELRVARLTHGLEPLRRLEVAAGLRSVAQDPAGGRFVVLDGAGRLHLHKEDGWAQETLPAPVGLTGLVTVLGPLGSVGRFVGWGPAGLAILRPNFSLLWLSEQGAGRAPRWAPSYCLPVPDLRLLLVAEMDGSLALWQFRSGGRRLVLRGAPLHPPLSPTARLMRLAVGPTPPHNVLCCFAAYGSAVLTFDLHAWALVDVRRDLHKTTISDLAYCEEVLAMVTASRDSTMKVWEADWQIRMVFVGHAVTRVTCAPPTGPVTAVAVLPNTTLVLSASQDGMLRTWDLQTAAQVGEVALGYWDQDKLSGRVGRLLAPVRPGWPVLCLCANSVQLWRVRELYSPLAQLPAKVFHLQVAPALPAPARPSLPTRLVCACTDGSVYLLSAATGRIVSALLLEPEDCAAAVAYCLPREALWLLTRAGHLVRANAARCPMSVLHRVCPAPPPAPQPCCLHLYSHLRDLGGAFSSWEAVRQHLGKLHRGAVAAAWKNKNRWVREPARAWWAEGAQGPRQQALPTRRYLPVVGHTDGTLSVLEWLSSKTVFQTEAHSPGPVAAIASTWNSIVSSGGDLTVKMWRVFPYAEESLSLLRTFSCCYPAVALCVLGTRVTVGFEDPDSATYGLVQFGLGDSPRLDHRPQDDPTDHITGLCCCPTLKLYACSSLDGTVRIWTAENRLLRLLQLNGAPQALAFCSNSGDLVLALGSRLCLVSHRLYLPTSYLVKNMCQKAPDIVDDPPLPLTSQESLTSTQLQRLTNLHGAASLSEASSLIHRRRATSQRLVLTEDLDALVARDQDLQQLRLGLVVPAARPPPSWQQRQEAFDNYLRLIHGSGLLVGVRPPLAQPRPPPLLSTHPSHPVSDTAHLLPPPSQGMQARRESQQWSTGTLTVERETWDVCALPRAAPCLGQAEVSTAVQTVPTALSAPDLGALGQHFSWPPQVTAPILPTHQRVHSKASQLLAHSSLSHYLRLSLELQLQAERLQGRTTMALYLPASHLQCRERDPGRSHCCQRDVPRNLSLTSGASFLPPCSPTSCVCGHSLLAALGADIRQSQALRQLCLHTPFPEYCPRPISFPGCVPNSVVLQQMWLPVEVSGLGSLTQLASQRKLKARAHQTPPFAPLQSGASQDDLWLWRPRPSQAQWQRKLLQWLGDKPREEEEEEQEEQEELDWTLDSLSLHSNQQLNSWELEDQSAVDWTQELRRRTCEAARAHLHHGHLLFDEHYGHLPKFLHFFIYQTWFKKLFPIFSLQVYPEAGTAEGLASMLAALLKETVWVDRVHILQVLLRLLPHTSRDLQGRLRGLLTHLLNLDPPPSLQDQTQKKFVMLALQLLLACSLESQDVVLELMSYFLYSPAHCRPELRKLLHGLGLQDPEGFLFEEMMTWAQDPGLDSKAALRARCCQKLEDMIQQLQVEGSFCGRAGAQRARVLGRESPPDRWKARSRCLQRLPKVSETSVLSSPPKETPSQASVVSGVPKRASVTRLGTSRSPSSISRRLSQAPEVSLVVASPVELHSLAPELQANWMLASVRSWGARRVLSETLQSFCPKLKARLRPAGPAELPGEPLPLEETDWSHSQLLDLGAIDALNFFCEQLRGQQRSAIQKETTHPHPPGLDSVVAVPNTVVPPPQEHRYHPVLRLQEAKKQRPARSATGLRGEWGPEWRLGPHPAPAPGPHKPLPTPGPMPSRLCASRTLDGPIRMLKLPLPRVEPQPFPPDWPTPARPLPPRLLQPALQRYFLPGNADPDTYS